MELKTYTVQDSTGAIVPGAQATLYNYPGGGLATGLKDKDGNELANPIIADSNGVVSLMAPDGLYEIEFTVGPTKGSRVTIQFVDLDEQLDQARAAAAMAVEAQGYVDAVTMAQTYTSFTAGLAGSQNGQIFRVITGSTAMNVVFIYYRRISSLQAETLQSAPNQRSINAMNAEIQSKLGTDKFEALVGNTRAGESLIFAVRDSEGRQTWIAATAADGGPSEWSELMIRQRLGLNEREDIVGGVEELAYAVTDSEDRLTDLAVRQSDGQLADFAVSRLALRIGQKLGVSADSVAQLLSEVKVTPDYPGFQIMSSISRWAGSRHLGGSVSSPVNFGTRTYNQAARMTFSGPYSDPQALLLVLYVGGVNSGSDLTVPEYMTPLLGEGVVVARCNYHGNHYGQPQAIQDMVDVYENVCKTLPIGGVILLGNSMGGMLALNALTTRAIPGVLGLYLTDPVANLADRYESERKAMIQAAYGIDSNGLDYTAKTSGYDPMLRDWSDYRGIPVAITGSTGDNLVPFAMNGLMLNEKLKAHNDVTLYTLSSAGHNTTDRFNITNLRAFIKKCVQGNILK